MPSSQLIQAVQSDDSRKFSSLLNNEEERMKILSRDQKGRTVLTLAAQQLNTEILQKILSLPEARQLVAIKDHDGLNILHYLCLASKKQPDNSAWNSIASQILEWQEATSLMQDKSVENQQNVMHYAAQQSNPILLKTFLKAKQSKKMLKEMDRDEKKPSDYAATNEMASQLAQAM